LQSALELEDTRDNGYLPVQRIIRCLEGLRIKDMKKEHLDYLMFFVYKESSKSTKMFYPIIFKKLLGDDVNENRFRTSGN
jgi:hypothetical protein